jgi:hypothetical protein
MALNYWIAFIDLEFGISLLGKNNKKILFCLQLKVFFFLLVLSFSLSFFLNFWVFNQNCHDPFQSSCCSISANI